VPRVSQQINAWNAGEFAPEIQGRTDILKYDSGAKRIENFIIRSEGGAHRRTGTRFVQPAIDDAKKSRLIPFIFSTTQAYILEFSDMKIRVFANEVRIDVEEHDIPHASLSTTTDEFEFTDHGYIDGQGPFQITATGTIFDSTPAVVEDTTDLYISMPKTMTFLHTDVTTATNRITFASNHEYVNQQGPFRLSVTEMVLPIVEEAGYGAYTDFYVRYVSATVIELSLTAGGAAVDLSDSADHYPGFPELAVNPTVTMTPTTNYMRDKFRLALTPGGTPIDITNVQTGPHTITPNPDGTPATLPFEIPTPYVESELYDLHVVQSADFLFIVHKNHRPSQLTRRGTTKWSLDESPIFDGPFLTENSGSRTLRVSAVSGYVDIVSVVGGGGGTGFFDSDIGKLVRIRHVDNVGYVEIGEIYGDTTDPNRSARGLIHGSDITLGNTATWSIGSWANNNWPQAISFFEQRLAMSGEPDTPQTLHGSATSEFDSFAPTDSANDVLDSSAINFAIGTNQANPIRWLAVANQLVAGTANSIFMARGSFDGEGITPTNIQVQKATAIGVLAVQPVNISDQLVYVTANSQSLRGMRLLSTSDPDPPSDITLLSKHIFGRTKTITTMAYQQDRQNVLWLTRSDGVMPAVTYVPEQDVQAWHRHIIGGSFGAGNAVVESVAVIPNPTNTHDQVWISVKRTVNGSTVRHIEFFEDEWLDQIATSMRFMDSAPLAYSGIAKSTFEGLDHLEGETVQVLANGAVHPDRVVSAGSITLDASYTDVVAGLKYTSEIETLNLDPPDAEGSSTGKVARIDHIVLRLFESIGGEIGPDVDNLDPLVFRDSSDPMDAGTPYFTGDKKIAYRGPFQRAKNIIIRQDQPLPFNLLSLNILSSTGQR
jgi:hypothetical protein